jgi:hypothetical protein
LALTYVQTPGNGTNRLFSVPFPFIVRAHVRVYLGYNVAAGTGAELVDGTGFTWLSDTQIQTTVAPAVGAVLTVIRKTPITEQLVVWASGSPPTPAELNTADLQNLYVIQELLDNVKNATYATSAGTAGYATTAGNATSAGTAGYATTAGNAAYAGTAGYASNAGFAKPDNQEPGIFYVRSDGSNAKDGRNAHNAFQNVEHALEQVRGFSTPIPWTIKILDGFSTAGELWVPDNTTIISANMQRRTICRPTTGNEVRNVLLCGNGVHIYGIKFTGWQVDDFADPTKGFAMAFRPGAIILPGGVPYGQNCVVTSAATDVPTPYPTSAGTGNITGYPRGGGCVLADASVLSAYSVFPNIMTWGFTPAVANGLGYVAKNRGFINPVNAIGVGAHRHFMCKDGGQMVVTGSSSQFGDYSFWSEGSTKRIVPLKVATSVITSQSTATTIINAQKTTLIDNMWGFLVSNHGAGSWSATFQTLTRKDAGLFLDALASSLTFGFERPMLNFAEGMFKFNGDCVYTYSYNAAFQASWDRMITTLLATNQLTTGAAAMAQALVTRLKATLNNHWYEVGQGPAPSTVEPVRRTLRSLITAINHQWTAPMSGVEFFRVPPARSARQIQRSIIRRSGGQVKFSGQDDAGNAVFVGGLTIDARSGQLGGPPFDSAIRARVTRAAISRSY